MPGLFVPEERKSARPAVLGLTGGIGSGKSSVASRFVELRVPVLDLDEVGYQVTLPGSEALAALVKQFGSSILDGDGLNRAKLAEICFASDENTRLLNRIVHPFIWQQADAWLQQQDSPYVVIEASVLIESGGCERVDRVLVVMAEEQARKSRVLERANMNDERFESIVARQCDDEIRLNSADYLIQNNSDIESLNSEVDALHGKLIGLFGGNSLVDTL
ncbi:MAG: dephospho-CoA kinase [Mariprofundaceae bacterium]